MRLAIVVLVLIGCGAGKPSVPDAGYGYAELGSDCAPAQDNTGSCSADEHQLLVCADGGWKLLAACSKTFCCNSGGTFSCDWGGLPPPGCEDGGH